MEHIVYLNSCNCTFSEQPEMRQDHSMCSFLPADQYERQNAVPHYSKRT